MTAVAVLAAVDGEAGGAGLARGDSRRRGGAAEAAGEAAGEAGSGQRGARRRTMSASCRMKRRSVAMRSRTW